MPKFESPSPISVAVARYLGEAIIKGEIAPGERLLEVRLCEQFGCSRSPVREAIRSLAAENLVTIQPRKGAHVIELTEKSVSDLFDVRIELERMAARLAATRITPEQCDLLTAMNESMYASIAKGDMEGYFTMNSEFHMRIAEFAGNEYLASLQNVAITRSFRTLFSAMTEAAQLKLSADMHTEIIDALRNRDQERASNLVKDHIGSAKSEALDLIQRRASSRTPSANT